MMLMMMMQSAKILRNIHIFVNDNNELLHYNIYIKNLNQLPNLNLKKLIWFHFNLYLIDLVKGRHPKKNCVKIKQKIQHSPHLVKLHDI